MIPSIFASALLTFSTDSYRSEGFLDEISIDIGFPDGGPLSGFQVAILMPTIPDNDCRISRKISSLGRLSFHSFRLSEIVPIKS